MKKDCELFKICFVIILFITFVTNLITLLLRVQHINIPAKLCYEFSQS